MQASEHPTETMHAMAAVRSAATVATKVEIESILNQESKSLEEEESEPVASRVIACDFRYDPYSDPSSAKSDQAYKELCRHNLVGARPNRQCIKDGVLALPDLCQRASRSEWQSGQQCVEQSRCWRSSNQSNAIGTVVRADGIAAALSAALSGVRSTRSAR